MYVRLAFAVAAHLEPEILIVDEVLAVGDAAFQRKCAERMRELTGMGRTVIVVSHSMASIAALCTKAIYLDHGRMVAMGPVSEVAGKYIQASREGSGLAQVPAHLRSVDQPARRDGTGRVRVQSMQLVHAEPGKLYEIPYGGSLALNVAFKSMAESATKVDLSIGINDEFGLRVFTGVSSWCGREYSVSAEFGEANIVVSDLYLRPGFYFIDLGLIEAGATVDVVCECGAFAISSTAARSVYPGALKWEPAHGNVDFPATFS